MFREYADLFRSCLWTVEMILLCLLLTGCGRQEADFLLSEADEKRIEEEDTPVPEVSEEPEEPSVIYVDVCGAVEAPGVYQLEAGSRVFQAIEAAGGFLPEAAGEMINRAQDIEDGAQVYVPTREEAEQEKAGVLPDEETGSAAAQTDARINLNTANEAALMTLSGIGQSKARDIISYREEHGSFSAIEEIMNVQGIKEGTFNKIKNDIVVE